MKVNTALELIDQLVLPPGWKITAEENLRFEESITVRLDYHTANFNRENAPEYQVSVSPHADFTIIVGTCLDDSHLYRKVVNAALKIQAHEWREAFRVQPTMWAPFHPHNIDGMKRWRDTEVMCDDDALLPDITFGL
jgi:hypothetical protein